MKKRKKAALTVLCLLCVLLLSTVSEAKSKKTKFKYPTGLMFLTEEFDQMRATVGFKYKLNTAPLSNKPVSAVKTDNSNIASISNGILSEKKTGVTYISYNYKNGDGILVTRKIKLTVVKNTYTYSKYGDILVSGFDQKYPELMPLKGYYKKNQMCFQFAVINNTSRKIKTFKEITFTIKLNGKKVAKNKFKNIKLNIKPHGKKKVTFKFPLKKTIYDIGSSRFGYRSKYAYTW